MKLTPWIVGGAVLLVTAATVYSINPNFTTIPSTQQTLTAEITSPSDGFSVVQPPGTQVVQGRCSVGDAPDQAINVLYVLDVSGSTDLNFMATNGIPYVDANGNGIGSFASPDAGDNFNGDAGDTEAGETLDGEISGVLALHASIGNPSFVSVGLEAFASNAAETDVGPGAGFQPFTSPPQNDANGTGGPDINEVVRTFRSEFNNPAGGSVAKFTPISQASLGSGTNFKEALQVVNSTIAQFPASTKNIVFFLSDGESNDGGRCFEGACTAELTAAVNANITIHTVGVGAGADPTDLQFIASQTGGTFTQVTDPSDLSTILPTIPPANLDHATVNGSPVTLGPLGNFSTTVNCGGLGPLTVTATCVASDPASTTVSADISLNCVATTTTTVVTTTTTTTTLPSVCGNGITEPGEQCDGEPCCSATCTWLAANTVCAPSPTQCSSRKCSAGHTCDTVLLALGTPCNDGDLCTENDRCDAVGICAGGGGPDSDGDGECDKQEIACGCNPFDAKEGCLLPNRLGGRTGNKAGEALINFYAPTLIKPNVTTDESCDPAGQCGDDGRCAKGKLRAPCGSNADCAETSDTCRIIVNWAGTADLTLEYAKEGRTPLPDFSPATPGCSRRVDVGVGPHKSVIKLKARGTIDGRPRKDRDVIKPHH